MLALRSKLDDVLLERQTSAVPTEVSRLYSRDSGHRSCPSRFAVLRIRAAPGVLRPISECGLIDHRDVRELQCRSRGTIEFAQRLAGIGRVRRVIQFCQLLSDGEEALRLSGELSEHERLV